MLLQDGEGRDRAPFPVDGQGLARHQAVLGQDRRIFAAGRRFEAIVEPLMQGGRRLFGRIHVDPSPLADEKRPEIVDLCQKIVADLRRDVMAVYDDTASIGKLYRRQDEIGTPWCITVDVDSLEDLAVTVRDRDSMTQERIAVEGVKRAILDRMEAARA